MTGLELLDYLMEVSISKPEILEGDLSASTNFNNCDSGDAEFIPIHSICKIGDGTMDKSADGVLEEDNLVILVL